MRKLSLILFILGLFIYLVIYKLFLISAGEFIRYIINPLVWVLWSVICYFLFYKKKNYKYFSDILYIVIGGALSYLIIFYTLGLFTGYTKNPYSLTLSGIVINSFSILLILGLKEYIRSILIWQVNKYRLLYLFLIFLLFTLSDLNWLSIIDSPIDILSIFNIIAKEFIPNLSINFFMMYLSINSGYLPGTVYRTLLFLPTLVFSIVPKYDWFITTLFDLLFPLFIFLVIQHIINKRNRMLLNERKYSTNSKRLIFPLSLITIIIMFGLGVFSIKPVVILTPSMHPSINPGDLVIIEEIDIENIRGGDIIQYKMNDYSVVHRVVMILKNNDEISLITKGDNNLKNDSKPIKKDQLIGRVKYRIPFVGYPSYVFQKLLGIKKVEVET